MRMYYQNQGFYNHYQNSYPYFDRYGANYGNNQTMQQSNAIGKIVDSIDAVKATDVPMDGQAYYFPKADGTEIYSKQWLMNGTTRILTYKPKFDDGSEKQSTAEEKPRNDLPNDVTTALWKRFDDIEMKLLEFDENLSKYLEKAVEK